MRKDIHIGYEHFKNSSELNEIEQALFEKAKSAREKAYAPYSDFFVGCAILLENGDIFSATIRKTQRFLRGFVRKEQRFTGLPPIFLMKK
jgi:cytidine deaminase